VGALNRRQTLDRLAYDLPDAILLDIMLPDGNGIDICHELRARPDTASVPIVMISAYSPPLIKEAETAGANGYLMKPIRLDELKATLVRVGVH
jgi:two-component system phosphate regulon response regulator PhoB